MNAIKLLSATLLIAAASSAFAGTDDGNVAPYQTRQTASTQAPAPTAAAASTKQADSRADKNDFARQISEGSDY